MYSEDFIIYHQSNMLHISTVLHCKYRTGLVPRLQITILAILSCKCHRCTITYNIFRHTAEGGFLQLTDIQTIVYML
jgi:hypothetical protein